VVEEYLAAKQVRPKSRREITRYLTDPAYFGALHRLPIDTVSRKDIATQLLTITRQRGAATARLARSALSAFFVWCMQMGLAEANPVIGTLQAETRPRDRVLDYDELAAIWKAADGDDSFSRIVRLLILTGARRSEVGGLAWSEIDLECGTWTIPKERSKNGRAHTLPLMPVALDLISARSPAGRSRSTVRLTSCGRFQRLGRRQGANECESESARAVDFA
jgi:integrase